MTRRRVAITWCLLFALAGCSGGAVSSSTEGQAPSSSSRTDCTAFTAYQGSAGSVVTFLYDQQAQPVRVPLESTWADFTRCTGIRIINEIDQTGGNVKPRLASGNVPDLLIVPQPGALADLLNAGAQPGGHRPVPAPPAVARNVDMYWNPAWRAYGSVQGVLYGSPLDASVKSLVWYSPRRFEELGIQVPKSWTGLMRLSEQVAKAGGTTKPWCGGIVAQGATGWPASDWLEATVLSSAGPDAYDAWVSHDLLFDSPTIRQAMDVLAGWMRNGDYVNGGFGDVASIARTRFPDVGTAVLDGTCLMYPFASYYADWWNHLVPGTSVGPDGDIFAFALPAVDPEVTTPIVGGGDFILAFSSRPEVQKAWAYLSSPDYATRRALVGEGFVSANSGVPLASYANPISRLVAKILTTSGAAFRFDGSDLIPPSSAEEEWRQLTAWFAEGRSTTRVLRAIDASWPAAANRDRP